MDFGKALELLKQGKKVSRAGWNGKGMWLLLVKHDLYFDGLPVTPFIVLKTPANTYQVWNASQADALATDWGVVDDVANVETVATPQISIPEGFTPWAGGECPVPPDTEVEVIFDDGKKGFCAATHLRWTNAPGFSIIAYRVVEPRTPKNETTEQAIQAAGANVAPRITPADIDANIASEHYFTAADGSELGVNCMQYATDPLPNALGLLTFCVLVLKNGFTVAGESACASPENFNAEIGRKIARENAINKVWPLLGYELRTKLAK